MGTDLAANGIMLEMRETHTDQSLPAETVRLIVLAAPDISTRDFEQNLRPNLVRPNVHMIVSCSLDLALELSQAFNLSDERLGHCAITARPHTMRGVDLVTVTGVQKFASHSYYLSAVTILDDIEKAFANGSAGGTSTSSGMVRRLDVH